MMFFTLQEFPRKKIHTWLPLTSHCMNPATVKTPVFIPVHNCMVGEVGPARLSSNAGQRSALVRTFRRQQPTHREHGVDDIEGRIYFLRELLGPPSKLLVFYAFVDPSCRD